MPSNVHSRPEAALPTRSSAALEALRAAGTSSGTAPFPRVSLATARPAARHRAWTRPTVLAIFGYLLAAAVVVGPAVLAGDGAWLGDEGDARIDLWYVGWVAHAITHLQSPFVTQAIHAPDQINLMWNASVLLPAIVLTPLTLVAGAAVAFNVLIAGAFTLTSVAAFAALRRIASCPAAWVGGLLYGFSPLMLSGARGQTHLLCSWLPPLVFLLLHDSLVTRRRAPGRTGVLLGLALGAQLVIAEEILVVTVIGTAIGLGIAAAQHRERVRETLPVAWRVVRSTAPVAFAVAAIPLAVQFLGPGRPGSSVVSGDLMASDTAGLLIPTSARLLHLGFLSDLAPRFSTIPDAVDNYIGLPMLILIVVMALAWRWDDRVRFAAWLLGAMTILSLGSHLRRDGVITPIVLPWELLGRLPLLGSLVPARFFVVGWFAIAILVATALTRWQTLGRRRFRVAGLSACAAAMLPIAPALPIPVHADDTPAFFKGDAQSEIRDGSTVLIAPLYHVYGEPPMTWQEEAGFRFRIVDGTAFSDQPGTSGRLDVVKLALADIEAFSSWHDNVDAAARPAFLAALRAEQDDYVLVAPSATQSHLAAFFTSLLGAPTSTSGGVILWDLHRVGKAPLP